MFIVTLKSKAISVSTILIYTINKIRIHPARSSSQRLLPLLFAQPTPLIQFASCHTLIILSTVIFLNKMLNT